MKDIPTKGTVLSGSLSDDVAAIQCIAAAPSILEVLLQVTGMGVAVIARVTEDEWVACAVRDEIGYGIRPGTQLELHSTLCDEVRGHRHPILIDNVDEDPIYRNHQTPRIYGFRSYISAPIVRTDGSFFGTLFAIHVKPARLSNSAAIKTFHLLAQLIALELDAGERIAARM